MKDEEEETTYKAGHSYLVEHLGRTRQVHIRRVTHTSYRYRYEGDLLEEWQQHGIFESENILVEDLGNEDE